MTETVAGISLVVRGFEVGTTGTNLAGSLALPPVPQFRFNHQYAMAVVEYLRSLKR